MVKEIDFNLYKHQEDFFFSERLHNGLVGGYGSGKTYGAIAKTVAKKLLLGSSVPVAYYLPTYGLIRDVAFPKFKEVFIEKGIPFTLNKSSHDFTTPYGTIHLRSMQNPDNIVGYETGYSLIDETDILPKKKMDSVFNKIIARNRKPLPLGMLNSTDVVGTPEGFKWFYDFFVKNKSADRPLVRGRTSDNFDLSDSYVETLRKTYTAEQLAAYLDGEFINLTSGSVYKYFKRSEHHTDRIVMPNDVLHVGMDFNVTDMSATVSVQTGGIYCTVDEITKVYDTFEMVEVLESRYSGHEIIVYPDASGKNRKTSSRKSDHQIIKDAGFRVRVKESNPFVTDRINSVNAKFMKWERFINTDKCPVLTEALENLAYKDGEPDKESGYDHITDAFGYEVYFNDKNKLIKGRSTV